MEDKKKMLADFAKYIYDNHTDQYGHLLLSKESDGEFNLTSFESVAEQFLEKII